MRAKNLMSQSTGTWRYWVMASEWEQHRLSDVLRLISGGTPRRSEPTYWGGDVPWLSVKDFSGDARYVSDAGERISQVGLENSSTKLLHPGQIIVSARGTVGELAQIARPMALNQSCYGLDGKPEYVTNDSLYYLLRHTVRDIRQITHGAVFDTITRETFEHIVVLLPNLEGQLRIADVLGSLDDKIELNHRMNRTLEKMAAAIFKSWFIDFDPVHAKAEGRDPGLPAEVSDLFPSSFEDSALGPIPKGWDVKPLDKVADYLNGLACQKHPPVEGQKSLPVIKIRELRQGITNSTDRASVDVPPKYIVEDGDVLFSWSGSLLVSIWCGGRGVLNQHVLKVTSASFPKWYFYQATKHHLDEFQRIASDKATTMGHIKRHHLTDAKMAIPDEKLMAKSTEVLGTMLDRRINALKQARILALTRDTLLPKLLSGEIELPAGEELAEEVS